MLIFFAQESITCQVQQTDEHEQNPALLQNITYSEAVKMNIDVVQTLDTDVMVDAQPIVVNKIDENVTPAGDSNKKTPPKPIQVRKISRFQVSHVQEDNIIKMNAAPPHIASVEVNKIII